MTGGIPGVIYNLISGQYQIGNMVFGKGTTVRVETFDIKPYDINAQDYQVTRSDETRFGWDSHKPTTIEITFNVLINRLLHPYEDYIPNFWDEMPTVADFQKVWRSDNIRNQWGQLEPLYCCGTDGITRAIYGRPGQFTYAKKTDSTEAIQCVAEFRRSDAFGYSVKETGIAMTQAIPDVVINGTQGDGPSWFRILVVGPCTNPSFTFTGLYLNGVIQSTPLTITVDHTLAAGEIVELNSYPWGPRRCVSSTGLNLTTSLSGDTPYLDRLRFGHDADLEVLFTAASMTSATDAVLLFRDAYQIVG